MPKRKKRAGLQKDFSRIFEGVWVPPKPHKEEARTEPTAQELRHAGETPVSDEQDRAPDTPAFNEADQPIETPVSDQQHRTADAADVDEQEHVADTAISDEQIREIERIMDSMKCSKGFICYKSGFKELCKVKNVGEGRIVECSPENQGPCAYRFTFTGKVFCKCPLRHYIARNIKR